MGQQQSKDELLYQQVNYGNVEGIKALRSEGAGLEVPNYHFRSYFDHFHVCVCIYIKNYLMLNNQRFVFLLSCFVQWIDKEGKTPLIAACMNSDLYNVAKTLIELGANVNAYRPGMFVFKKCHLISNSFC